MRKLLKHTCPKTDAPCIAHIQRTRSKTHITPKRMFRFADPGTTTTTTSFSRLWKATFQLKSNSFSKRDTLHSSVLSVFILQEISPLLSCWLSGNTSQLGPKRDHVLHGRDQVWPGRRDWPRRPVHQNRRGTGSTPSSRSPADQVGRDQSRLPGSLVNGTTGLDTWSRWINPVMAGVDYLVPSTFLGRDTGLTPFP